MCCSVLQTLHPINSPFISNLIMRMLISVLIKMLLLNELEKNKGRQAKLDKPTPLPGKLESVYMKGGSPSKNIRGKLLSIENKKEIILKKTIRKNEIKRNGE